MWKTAYSSFDMQDKWILYFNLLFSENVSPDIVKTFSIPRYTKKCSMIVLQVDLEVISANSENSTDLDSQNQ